MFCHAIAVGRMKVDDAGVDGRSKFCSPGLTGSQSTLPRYAEGARVTRWTSPAFAQWTSDFLLLLVHRSFAINQSIIHSFISAEHAPNRKDARRAMMV